MYNDPELLALFPRLSENDLRNLTGGSYHLKKAHGYINIQLDYYKNVMSNLTTPHKVLRLPITRTR